jgi:nucleotidyltransferase substrate binding protein (TIGR01987 family)
MSSLTEHPDVRWKQRLRQFEKSFAQLELAMQIISPSFVERAGLIQFFEMAFEQGWKLLKDYLTEQGFDINSPREAIKQAFQNQLIVDGHLWLQALEDRNLTTHTYNEVTAELVEKKIRNDYFLLLKTLKTTMAGKQS